MAGGRFKSLSVSDKVYEKLKEIAERRGFATLADTIAYLVTLEEEVLRRLEHVTTARGNITATRGNVTANSGNITSTGGNVGRTKVFCKKRGEIVDIKHFIEKLEKKGVLVDWWEEGEDAVCFELKREVFIKRE